MTKKDLAKVLKILEKTKFDLETKINEDSIVETRLSDEMDQSIELANKQFKESLRARDAAYLKKVNLALHRIATGGNFGTCQECEEEIAVKRLFIRPTAFLCTPCQEAQEHKKSQLPIANRGEKVLGV
jgi:DnaK suppressor protein